MDALKKVNMAESRKRIHNEKTLPLDMYRINFHALISKFLKR